MADKIKNCKSCGQQIAKGAKICPYCGGKNKGSKIPIVIGVIVVLLIIGALSSGGNSQPQKVNDGSTSGAASGTASDAGGTAQSQGAPESFSIGDTADFDGIQIKVSSAVLSKGSEFVKPDDGKLFLGVIVDIVNNSSNDINISSMANFEAYCDDYALNQDILGYQAPEIDGFSQLDGSVAAGKKMNGVIAYQVPEDFKTFDLSISPDFWSSQNVKYTFTKGDCDSSAI